MYICKMKKIKTKILQQRFSVNKYVDDYDNYLVLIEIVDGKPSHSYVVPMYNYNFCDETFAYYTINSN